MIKVFVSRFDSEKDEEPHLECYEIEKTPQMKVLDALQAINEKYDEDISFRSSCRAGQCGSCGIKYKGNGALACKKEIADGAVIEPLDLPIIKDLVVDKSEIEEKVKDLHLNLNSKKQEEIKTDFNNNDVKDTKKVRGCIECYSCLSTCPVVKHFKEEFDGPYLMRYMSKFGFDPREDESRLNDLLKEGLYNCTSCGKCGSICPKNINSFGDAIEKMREVACQNDLGPLPEHKDIKERVEKTGRSINLTGKSFIDEADKKEKKSKVALFTGCMVDYKLQDIGEALLDVLDANGIEIDIPEGQVCCGSPLIRTGQTDIVQDLVDKNKEVFKDYDTVLTVCAGCGATLKNDHPEYGSNLNVQDISEFLKGKLDKSKMKDLDMTVTWHDPCHLSRSQGIKDEPRDIIEDINGVKLVEMQYPCQCCGAGGGIKSGKPEIALELSKSKAEMIKDTGAEAVITICPFCQYNLQDGLDEIGLTNVKSMNILELLQKAYAKEE
ncbi:succinate dehydrogenase/fumarate reductase iron-sulfur subunit [Methanobrevibacter sp. OttesenSCG-928-K11]|nr:succinate dehydrogenase/fumarate reductase iron-sulfur subunit [Methanobrevibacter sp. OttesenSCG-928-K11]MDL2270496.1 succinate dehydrogenase/fumarate reductase iron-sulfur subunit [Methanobrevibacter sp. OttesenSCG-928-I08]